MTSQKVTKELKQLEEPNMLSINRIEKNSDILSKLSTKSDTFDKYALFYSIVDEQKLLGYIALNRISQMNEYKLGKLYIEVFNNGVYDDLDKEFDILLENFINKEFYLKITIDIEKTDVFKKDFIKKHSFVINKENDENFEYKITKPIYLEGRK